MITFLDEIRKRLQTWHEERANRIEEKRQAQLDSEAREAVQVMEFNGKLYIDIFKDSVAEVVACGRRTYKDWKEEKLWERTGTTQGFIPC